MVRDIPEPGQDEIEATLEEIRVLRLALAETREREKMLSDIVKKWMEDHKVNTLVNDAGLKARLSRRRRPDVYDVRNMPEDLILGLHKLNALKLDLPVIRANKETREAALVRDFAMPGGEDLQLRFE